jgi:hypothetical protein
MPTQSPVVDILIGEAFKGLDDIPKPRLMPGGFFQFEVSDVGAAVALAARFKQSGRYSYFRGQRDAHWRVLSKFARLDREGREAANADFNAFRAWVQRSPELVPYLDDGDKIIAAAQHHEVCATTFLDLSTDPEVAGWFATDGAHEGDSGALYLVNPGQLQPVFDAFSSDDLILRFVEITVPNLWRLQAQHGLFLECNTDLDRIWPLDRIVFRQNGTPGPIERGRIYPVDRSQLEQMIDQHRLLKRREEAMQELVAGSGILAFQIDEAPDTVPAEFGAPVRPAAWAAGPDESWDSIDPQPSADPWSAPDLREATDTLAALIDRRRHATRLLTVDDPELQSRLQALVDRIWAGMRPYPYDAAAIARAITALARFEVFFRGFDLGAGLGTMPVAQRSLIDPVELEFGIAGGGGSRACVSGSRLLDALSEDARRHLNLTDSATGALVLERLAPYWGKTLRCFDQARLLNLFVDEIIPWQVVSMRDPIAFSSLHITTLGRP